MVKNLLVEPFKVDGERLLDALNKRHFPLTAALWRYLPDEVLWRLLIVSPVVDKEGPLQTYRKIMKVLENLKPPLKLKISNISVMSSKWQQFRDVQRTVENMVRRGTDLHDSIYGDAHVYWWDGKPVEAAVAERHGI